MNMNAEQYFELIYGDLGLSPNDAARWVFATGWNCALQEMLDYVTRAPLERDTQASFAVFLQNKMCVDPLVEEPALKGN
jgi:hypothetical protein